MPRPSVHQPQRHRRGQKRDCVLVQRDYQAIDIIAHFRSPPPPPFFTLALARDSTPSRRPASLPWVDNRGGRIMGLRVIAGGRPEQRVGAGNALTRKESLHSRAVNWRNAIPLHPQPNGAGISPNMGGKGSAATCTLDRGSDVHAPIIRNFYEPVKTQTLPCSNNLQSQKIRAMSVNDLISESAKIGGRLKHLRECYGLTQAELERRWGLEQGRVYNWESGRSDPGKQEMARYIVEFGVTSDWILYGLEHGITFKAAQRLGLVGRAG